MELLAEAVGPTAIPEPLVPLDDESLRQLLRTVGQFEEGGGWQERESQRRFRQEASWNALARQLLSELEARLIKQRREYDQGLATLRLHTDDPGVRVYITNQLKSEDHLMRREAVRVLARLKRSDWVVAALTDVAHHDPFQARRSTSSIEYTDPDVAEMYVETYFELREEAEQALLRLA